MRHNLSLALLALSAAFLPSCGGGGGGGGPTPQPVTNFSVTGEVLDANGRPIDGVLAEVVGTQITALSDQAGSLALGLTPNTRQTLKLSKDGFTEQFVVVEGDVGRSRFTARLRSQAIPMAIASIENGGSAIGEDGVTIELPPNSLVMPDGSLAAGDITVAMTPVDVTDPDEGAAFPGEYSGRNMDGTLAEAIMSLGTAEFILRQGSEPLQVAPGATATIELPLYATQMNGVAIQTGDMIPLWSLDETAGDWDEETMGTVIASSTSPTGFAVRGEVTHFSWWNIDIAVDPARVRPVFEFPPGITPPDIVTISGEVTEGDGPRGRVSDTVSSGTPATLAAPPGTTVVFCAFAVDDLGNIYRGKATIDLAQGQVVDLPIEMIPGLPFIDYFELTSVVADTMTFSYRVVDADVLTLNPGNTDISGTASTTLPFALGTYELTATNQVGTATATLEVTEATMRDTSAYTGRLAWSPASAFGGGSLTVWDMQQSRAVLRIDPVPGEAIFAQVSLNRDGDAAAYTRLELFGLFSGRVGSINRADLTSGDVEMLPFETATPGEIRNSLCPTISNNGDVAFEQFTLQINDMGFPDDESSRNIALWDASGAVRVLTDSEDDDQCPTITQDGNTVVFLSDRSGNDGLWRIATAPGSTPEAWFTGTENIVGGLRSGRSFDLTADGSRAAFQLSDEQLVVLDEGSTTPTEIFSAADPDVTLTQFSMSLDGSRIIYSTLTQLEDNGRSQLWLQDLDSTMGPVLLQDSLLTDADDSLATINSPRLSPTGDSYAAVFRDGDEFLRLDIVGIDSRAPATITVVDDDPTIISVLEGTFAGQ